MGMGKFDNYYLGLDIGTDSVGWCVTNTEYNVLKFRDKAMWGIRLFDPASTAADRRAFRTARRRLDRRQQRVNIVEELLAEEISKVDPAFYQRMKESKFLLEDKDEKVRGKYCLFADKDYTDVDYYKEFPTIYHLRSDLMKHKKKYDIRLYYLAIVNFMKHRGHFLFSGNVSDVQSFEYVFGALSEYILEHYDIELECKDYEKTKGILLDSRKTKNDKKRELLSLFDLGENDKELKELKASICAAVCGATVQLDKLFGDETLKDADVVKIAFADGIDDAKEGQLIAELGERYEFIEKIKAVYDWSVLIKILGGFSSISDAQVAVYEKHASDLKNLKYVIKTYGSEVLYKEIFIDPTNKTGYSAYTNYLFDTKENKGAVLEKKIEQNVFCDYIKKTLSGIKADDPLITEIIEDAAAYTFMPKQVSKSNSVIPYQIHEMDLKKILAAMGEDYPELAEKESDGYSVCDKILQTYTFRIPYYVGPLNPYHSDKGGNSWVVRKEGGRVYPWNFSEKVDSEASAEKFIRRMTNKCTYLFGEDVLPRNSLLYEKYMLLNELNNIRINGNRLSVALKQRIFDDVFKKRGIKGKVTLNKFKNWLIKENIIEKNDLVSGIDLEFKAELKAYYDFYNIIGNRANTEIDMIEEIIKEIVVFPDDAQMLRKRIKAQYGTRLTDDEIKKIIRLKYSGWGNFSEKFLNGITDIDKNTGKEQTIIEAMWNGSENLMELLSSRHGYAQSIEDYNSNVAGNVGDISYKLVEESYASPAVKRAIWQTLSIVKELKQVTGTDPKRVFVEVTRQEDKKKKRTVSRKEFLLSHIKNNPEFAEFINSREERDFNSKKLFLYCMQMGRDMYSGKPIDLSELNTNKYDIDHIFPQSKTKDDSINNNMVLTASELNREKGDKYPIPDKLRQSDLWMELKQRGLITEEKYVRLTRRSVLTEDELAGFIARQLVETSQTVKAVTDILEETMPDVTIVYSKAHLVSQFRKENGFIKSRAVNDYHHAKDAYLNIVVGNVYYTKFTSSPANYIRNSVEKDGEKYSLNHMFDFNVERNGLTAWVRGKNGTIATVNKYMNKNNILFIRYASEKHGGYYDMMPLKKGTGQMLPLKSGDERLDVNKYGGYNKPSINYYMLVESDDKKKGRIRTIEGVPVYLSNTDNESLIKYCTDVIGLKNPRIIVNKLRINSLLIINSYPMHISGKSNNRIAMKNAVQLCLDQESVRIIHRIEKIVEHMKEDKNYVVDPNRDGIKEELLINVYDKLKDKTENSIYSKRPAQQTVVLKKGRERFISLTINEKCGVIMEILHLFECGFLSADLKQIGGVGQAGVFTIGNNISKCKSALWVNQSVTGLIEQKVDLLK